MGAVLPQPTLLLSTAVLYLVCSQISLNVLAFSPQQWRNSCHRPCLGTHVISHRCTRLHNQRENTNDASPTTGFWQQPTSTLKSVLPSPPPKEILVQIRSDPYKGGFEPVTNFDNPQSPKIIFGFIPEDLVGTLAINGAGRIRIGARMLGHWFDGDGFITTLSFDGRTNSVRVFGKYVETARFQAQKVLENNDSSFIDEDEEYKPPLAFLGAWTKAGNGNFWDNIGRIPQNPSNTAVMWLPPLKTSAPENSSSTPRLYSLCEGGHPIELDPTTLEVVRNEQPFRSSPFAARKETISSFFSAHPSIDPNDGTIYNHGYSLINMIAPPSINLMKLSPEGHLLHQAKSEMPYNTFVHDATISRSHMVYFVCPYLIPTGMGVIPLILGTESLGGLMTWRGGHYSTDSDRLKSYLHVHGKKELSLKWRIEIPHPTTVFHVVDAFEEETDDGDIMLKVRVAELESSDPPCDRPLLEKQFANQYAVPLGTRLHSALKEYTFFLRNDGSGKGKFLDCTNIGAKTRKSIPCDYPITNKVGGEVRLRYAWIDTIAPSPAKEGVQNELKSDWFDAIQKVDMDNANFSSDTVTFGEGVYCGPPLFIQKATLYQTSDNPQAETFGEDEGYIVVVLYLSNEHRSDVVILDSQSMEVLCRMKLESHLAYSFHGEFIPGFVGYKQPM